MQVRVLSSERRVESDARKAVRDETGLTMGEVAELTVWKVEEEWKIVDEERVGSPRKLPTRPVDPRGGDSQK